MKRHSALTPLSRDHHHALVEAQRLRRAASADEGRLRAADRFVGFFARDTVAHFREEEEVVFPVLLRWSHEPPELLVRALVEHQRIHELVHRLRRGIDEGEVAAGTLLETGELLEAHIRMEERELFPLIERLLPEEELAHLVLAARSSGLEEAQSAPPDPRQAGGRGPIWGLASEDLNATLLAWGAGEGIAEHVESERDVLLVVVGGSATIRVDGAPQALERGGAILVEKGRRREIVAGPVGVRYVSAHLRRTGLTIERRPQITSSVRQLDAEPEGEQRGDEDADGDHAAPGRDDVQRR
jgi:hemerythrin-like domain-containing protein/quercetin dioxygenase-like cupin family protein